MSLEGSHDSNTYLGRGSAYQMHIVYISMYVWGEKVLESVYPGKVLG